MTRIARTDWISRGIAALSAVSLAAAFVAPAAMAQDDAASRHFVVLLRGLRSDRGEVSGAVYSSARGWLQPHAGLGECHAPITNGEARCEFDVPARASVAFTAMHDEDMDGEFDRDPIGLPQEGYAFSNDVREPFGPPSFQAASFAPPSARPFVVHVRYGI